MSANNSCASLLPASNLYTSAPRGSSNSRTLPPHLQYGRLIRTKGRVDCWDLSSRDGWGALHIFLCPSQMLSPWLGNEQWVPNFLSCMPSFLAPWGLESTAVWKSLWVLHHLPWSSPILQLQWLRGSESRGCYSFLPILFLFTHTLHPEDQLFVLAQLFSVCLFLPPPFLLLCWWNRTVDGWPAVLCPILFGWGAGWNRAG